MRKLARGEIPTYQEMVDLLDAAEAGDAQALSDAQAISSQLSKRANVRLQSLEAHDFESSPAYMRVRDMLDNLDGRVRFSESKHLSREQLETQLEELSIFMRDETGTIPGEKMRRSGIDTMIEENQIEIHDEKTRRALLRFLESDEWNAYRKLEGYVQGSMQTIVNAIENGNTLKDFKKLYQKAVSQGSRNLSTLLTDWERM